MLARLLCRVIGTGRAALQALRNLCWLFSPSGAILWQSRYESVRALRRMG